VVTNPNLEGIRLDAIPGRLESGVTISRVRHGDETQVATDATVIHRDDRECIDRQAGLLSPPAFSRSLQTPRNLPLSIRIFFFCMPCN